MQLWLVSGWHVHFCVAGLACQRKRLISLVLLIADKYPEAHGAAPCNQAAAAPESLWLADEKRVPCSCCLLQALLLTGLVHIWHEAQRSTSGMQAA